MKVRIGHEARQEEIADAAVWYHREREGLGAELRLAVRDAIDGLSAAPERFPTIADGFRRCRVDKFPYGVVDEVHDEQIIVVAVMHLHRRPDYWRDRT